MEPFILSLLMIIKSIFDVQAFPIAAGIRLHSVTINGKLKQTSIGTLFAKIPQELSAETVIRRSILPQDLLRHVLDSGTGSTNQIARIIFPFKNVTYTFNNTQPCSCPNYLNLPIVKQPFEKYNILVATAPQSLNVVGDGSDNPTVVYIVYPDKGDDPKSVQIPKIYFVNKQFSVNKTEQLDPVLIVNSNRTVTKLKSREISRTVKFKNRSRKRYHI